MDKILHQLTGSFSITYRVLYIPGDAGFLPSTVLHQPRFPWEGDVLSKPLHFGMILVVWDCAKNWPDESAWWLRLAISIAPTKFRSYGGILCHFKLPSSPENGWLEDDPGFLGLPIFRGYVSFREYTIFFLEKSTTNQHFKQNKPQQPLRSTNSSSGRSKNVTCHRGFYPRSLNC